MPCSPFLTGFLLADANVTEGTQVRLVNGPNRCAGRVEVLHEQQWGTVCDDSWDLKDAKVVCRQLGCGTAVSAPGQAHFGQGLDPIWLDDVECTGMETTLSQCSLRSWGLHNCNHDEDVGVVCSGGPRGECSDAPKKGFIWDEEAGSAGGTSVMGMTLQGSWGGGTVQQVQAANGTHAHPCTPLSVCVWGRKGHLIPFALSYRHKPLAAAGAGWSRSLRGASGGALQRYLARGVRQQLELAGSRGGLQAAGLRASPVGTRRSLAQAGGQPCLAGGTELPGDRVVAPGVPAERDGSGAVQAGLGSQRGVRRAER